MCIFAINILDMDVNELSDLILRKCKAKGLCQDGQRQWDGSSKSSLLKMYLKEPEFSVQNKPLSLYFIRDYFEKELLNENGIYVLEDNLDLQINEDRNIILNGCNGSVEVNSSGNVITISDNSNIDIVFNKVGFYTLNINDLSDIHIECLKDCNIVVFSWGNNNIEKGIINGKIKIIKK